jgi:hypothetical protein
LVKGNSGFLELFSAEGVRKLSGKVLSLAV